MTGKHSILPPSRASRRVACPGSRALEELYPETEKLEAAVEGDVAHAIAADMLRGTFNAAEDFMTTEMIDGAVLYQEDVISCVGTSAILHIEEPVSIETVHSECWGTPDCWVYQEKTVYIWDYKFGRSPVEVFENYQLLEYAIGIIDQLQKTVNRYVSGMQEAMPKYVNMRIVQPRDYHSGKKIKEWIVTVDTIFTKYLPLLKYAEALSMEPNARCQPSPECTHCRARHACRALGESSLAALQVSSENTPLELSPDSVGYELRFLKRAYKLLQARITGLEQQALSNLKSGKRVPYFQLSESRPREKWKKSVDEVAAMGSLMGKDILKPVEAITPKQAIAAGIPADIVKQYSEVLPGELALEEVNLKNFQKLFSS